MHSAFCILDSTLLWGEWLARRRNRAGEHRKAGQQRCGWVASCIAVFGWLLSVFIGLEVSTVSSPRAGRLEGASDRPEFVAIHPKTAPAVTHCQCAACGSVTWKN
jgi:hypothetical protein